MQRRYKTTLPFAFRLSRYPVGALAPSTKPCFTSAINYGRYTVNIWLIHGTYTVDKLYISVGIPVLTRRNIVYIISLHHFHKNIKISFHIFAHLTSFLYLCCTINCKRNVGARSCC